ncbi:hypothetical protein [Flavobacterium sp. FlaQc-47]|uniref:hypothetical protein n=1 Tax=Flavobacterium sp. FlaQc-47 TaxID=3374180 RepID=UPI003756BCEA
MQLPFELYNEILKILAQNSTKTFSLEELTSNIFSSYNKSQERENQARILDVLIFLESKGLIFLNSLTDESQVKIKTNLQIV